MFFVGGLGFGGPKTQKNGKTSPFSGPPLGNFQSKRCFSVSGHSWPDFRTFFPPPSFAIFALRRAKPKRSKTSSLLAFSFSSCQFPLCLLFPVWCSFFAGVSRLVLVFAVMRDYFSSSFLLFLRFAVLFFSFFFPLALLALFLLLPFLSSL